MTLKRTTQESWKYRVAALVSRLDDNGICAANHDIRYANGWYYIDDRDPSQRPDITRRARELENDPDVRVFFNEGWNTYVLSYVDWVQGDLYPTDGRVTV